MIASTNRIHGRNVFSRIFKQGRIVRINSISLNYSVNKGDRLKAAVVVSRKTSKKAVTRNIIRRRVYEIIRRKFQNTNIGCNLIFMVYSDEIATIDSSLLEEKIDSLLQKAGILIK